MMQAALGFKIETTKGNNPLTSSAVYENNKKNESRPLGVPIKSSAPLTH